VGVNPEIAIFEGADGCSLTRRQHLAINTPSRRGLPGAWTHVESPRKHTEQERPIGNRGMVSAGAYERGRTGALCVNGRWESDPSIVVMKLAKSAFAFERVERRGGPGKDFGGGRVD
jgi:hypothetical protein